MTLTERDRKIVLFLIPIAIVVAYWFLLLAPKRQEAASVSDQLSQAQTARDTAVQRANQLETAKRSFASDYATVIRLGKSIPTNVDMPSLLLQLDRAARGTGISFTSISTGDGSQGGAAAGFTPPGGADSTASSSTPAQSGAGKTAQAAGSAVNSANSSSGASQAAAGATSAGATTAPAGLQTIPLDFEFDGSFFHLADFFHRMKRFVHVANDRIVVRGRLMTVNSFELQAGESFPTLTATVHATVYLAPKSQGVSAGATSQGPAGAPPAPAGQTASTKSTPPAAAVITR